MKFNLSLFIFVFAIILNSPLIYASVMIGKTVFTKHEVNVFSEGTFESKKLQRLPAESPLLVLFETGFWFEVETSNNTTGWVAKKWVERDKNEIKREQERAAKLNNEIITELVEKAKGIPASEVYENIEVYSKLVKLAPANEKYKNHLKHYEEKAKRLFDFRKTKWGMRKDQVITAEGKEPKEAEDDLIYYEISINDFDMAMLYFFADNQLTKARYALSEEHSNKNDFITDYNNLKELLKKKYGPPDLDRSHWKNDLLRDNKQQWGIAIATGDLVYAAQWDTPTTGVSIALQGDNYQIYCFIDYEGKKFTQIERKAKEKKALDQL